MRELVGVRDWATFYASLKRDALIFNRIAVPSLYQLLTSLTHSSDEGLEPVWNELCWLISEGIIFQPEFMLSTEQEIIGGNEEINKLYNLEVEHSQKAFAFEHAFLTHLLSEEDFRKFKREYARHSRLAEEFRLRRCSTLLRSLENVDAYPILSGLNSLEAPFVEKRDVIEITLKAIPVPQDSVAWEQIIEYRSDPDTRGKFLALRNWMSEVAREKLSSVEVEDKLEYLMYEYQSHIKLHKLKTNVGTLETIIVTGAEILENLVKFNWGKVAKQIFSLKHRQITLLEGEMSSPGKEVAYIIEAKDKLA
jgi:hypothetical protein